MFPSFIFSYNRITSFEEKYGDRHLKKIEVVFHLKKVEVSSIIKVEVVLDFYIGVVFHPFAKMKVVFHLKER